MYSDNKNLGYLRFLKPILEEVQNVNKSFESNNADPCKLLSVLTNLVKIYCKKNCYTHVQGRFLNSKD